MAVAPPVRPDGRGSAVGSPMPLSVDIRGLEKSLGGKRVLRGVTLAVDRGQTVVLMGASGSGKTVLLKHVVGLLTPDAGTIRVAGCDLSGGGREAVAQAREKIGYLFQGAALLNSLTVLDNVALPLREKGMSDEDVRRQALDRLDNVGLREAAGKFPAQLSGGMRKRVGLARAIMGTPEIVLYDEPTSGLDPPTAAEIGDLIRALQKSLGITSLVVAHDLPLALRIADRIALLHEGRVRWEGTPAEMERSDDEVVRAFLDSGARHPVTRQSG